MPLDPVFVWVLHQWEVAQLADLLVISQVFVKDDVKLVTSKGGFLVSFATFTLGRERERLVLTGVLFEYIRLSAVLSLGLSATVCTS